MNISNIEIAVFGGVLLFTILVGALILFLFAYRNKQRHHQTEKHLLQNQYQKTILETKLEVSEQTMKQIAQEIHDNIGQRITLAIQSLEFGNAEAGEVKELLSGALQDLRDLSKSLHTSYITEMGLDLAVEKECEIVAKSSGIECSYKPQDLDLGLSSETELILYRCLQETLINAVKHSQAKQIRVALNKRAFATELTVIDNGVGFNTSKMKKGVGINSLQERVNLLNGDLQILSTIGTGTEVRITVPQNLEPSSTENK